MFLRVYQKLEPNYDPYFTRLYISSNTWRQICFQPNPISSFLCAIPIHRPTSGTLSSWLHRNCCLLSFRGYGCPHRGWACRRIDPFGWFSSWVSNCWSVVIWRVCCNFAKIQIHSWFQLWFFRQVGRGDGVCSCRSCSFSWRVVMKLRGRCRVGVWRWLGS